MDKTVKKNRVIIILIIVLILLVCLLFFSLSKIGFINFFNQANLSNTIENPDKVKVKSASISSVATGELPFDNNDDAGNDSGVDNRVVRSFDTITYSFDILLADKEEINNYQNRTLNIDVELSEEESKYVSFEQNSNLNETKHTYSFENLNTNENYQRSITLYVSGAPNGFEINPKFVLKENTDTSEGIMLGKVSTTDTYYSFVDNNYNSDPTIQNVLPTIVSSKPSTIKLETLSADDNQAATYNGKDGRYITVVSGLYIEGNSEKGLKGLDIPKDSITFDVNMNQDSDSIVLKEEWSRLYGINKIEDINSITVNLPYSTNDSNIKEKQITTPGVLATNIDNNRYRVSVSGYEINNSFPSLTATDQSTNNKYYFGTYAFTGFSPRSDRREITVNYSIDSFNITGTNNERYIIEPSTGSIINRYLQTGDYNYDSGFYLKDDKKINSDNTIGSLSKGTEIVYKTEFKNNTSSSTSLKEIIKINPNGFRIYESSQYDDNELIDIETVCGDKKCDNISKDSFEIKYITGDFNNSNYKIIEPSSKMIPEEKDTISNICSNTNLSSLTNDQMMNIYGSPCLEAKENIEKNYTDPKKSVDQDNKEIPITKVIVQTKSGVSLPEDASIKVRLKLRVRNVKDLTRLYQVTSTVSTSDYDRELVYYYPSIDNIMNPDNYTLPTIQGSEVVSINNVEYADSIRISNYTSDQKISVLNKKDDKMKTEYDTKDNETITYNIKPIIEDNSESVGNDDTWFIKYIRINVLLPKELIYIENPDLDTYLVNVTKENNQTVLEYVLPYTKPNMDNGYVRFDAKLSNKIKGNKVPVTITSSLTALNVNKEVDSKLFGETSKEFTIYATGEENIIVEQRLGNAGSEVEKNAEFSYLLTAYNNTDTDVNNYSIVDILPYDKDLNKSSINGTYKVKLVIPESLSTAKVYCTTKTSTELDNSIDSDNNWEECDLVTDYKEVTGIKITDININHDSELEPIELKIKPENNKSGDKYNNEFIGGTSSDNQSTSNKLSVNVISRSISGKVFHDTNENGVQDTNDKYVSDMTVTLYKIEDEDNKKVSSTKTDKDGKYIFNDLEIGEYYIDFNYDGSKYDLSLRYATNDENIDSDAYKVSDTLARISNKRTPNDPFGIRITNEDKHLENYDMGLISKYSFGFGIKKYITKIDLTYSGVTRTTNYNNESKVTVNVRNVLKAELKVYYGIEVFNNSNKAGYVDEIDESIPEGLVFDPTLEENKDWSIVNGKVISTALSKTLIKPGESRKLQIVLKMPRRESAGTFVNTVSVVNMTEYVEKPPVEDSSSEINRYELGDEIDYAGIGWHVIDVIDDTDGSQKLTLLADSGSISTKMSHTDGLYKWGLSNINSALNNNTLGLSLDYSALYNTSICNDASGMEIASFGGNINGTCQSGDFVNSKVRLLSIEEYTKIRTSELSNIDWLTGNEDYWLQSTDDTRPIYDAFGSVTTSGSTYNKASYASSTGVKSDLASTLKEVRPVITVSSNSIFFE